MKRTQRILSTITIFSLAVFASCGSDDAATPAQKTELGKLTSKTWTVTKATDAFGDRTSDFTGVTLTITGSFNSSSPNGPYDYAIAGTLPSPSPWPADGETDGKWSFVAISSSGSQILRDPGSIDEVAMTYVISGNTLTINFLVEDGGGWNKKVSNVSGTWEFEFTGS